MLSVRAVTVAVRLTSPAYAPPPSLSALPPCALRHASPRGSLSLSATRTSQLPELKALNDFPGRCFSMLTTLRIPRKTPRKTPRQTDDRLPQQQQQQQQQQQRRQRQRQRQRQQQQQRAGQPRGQLHGPPTATSPGPEAAALLALANVADSDKQRRVADLMLVCTQLTEAEAKAYLFLHDYALPDAIEAARLDEAWERATQRAARAASGGRGAEGGRAAVARLLIYLCDVTLPGASLLKHARSEALHLQRLAGPADIVDGDMAALVAQLQRCHYRW